MAEAGGSGGDGDASPEAGAVQDLVAAGLEGGGGAEGEEQELESLDEETGASGGASSEESAEAEALAEGSESAGGGTPASASGEEGTEALAGGGPAGGDPAGGGAVGGGNASELDAELEQSLQVFEGEMAGRITVIASADGSDLSELEDAMPAGGEGEEDGEGTPDQTGDGGGLVLVEGDLSLLEGGSETETRTVTSGVITGGGGLPDPEGEREGEYKDGRLIAKRIPEDIGDGSDDDVVARQIREAAMNEQDPVLREKLWEEYRNYKKSIR